ncbi:hypothetical protein ACFLYA_01700 [Candidatus Dependentiae bacterium]
MKKLAMVLFPLLIVANISCMEKEYLERYYLYLSKAYLMSRAIKAIKPFSKFTEKKSKKHKELTFWLGRNGDPCVCMTIEDREGKTSIKIGYFLDISWKHPSSDKKWSFREEVLTDKHLKKPDLAALKKILFKKIDELKAKKIEEEEGREKIKKMLQKKAYENTKTRDFADVKIFT